MAMKIELVRPDDLLNLQIEAANLRLDAEDSQMPALVVEDARQPAYLTFIFPPQTIVERAYFEAALVPSATNPNQQVATQPAGDPRRPDAEANKTVSEPLPPPGQTRTSGRTSFFLVAKLGQPSRLVFKIPAEARIPFSIEGLLDWSQLELSLNSIAVIGANPTAEQIRDAPSIGRPAAHETALEMPYNLVISPNRDVAWAHRFAPFTARGRTELWHTRLQLKTAEGPVEISSDRRVPLRAIWSPDYKPRERSATAQDPELGRTAISPDDRHQLVILTSAFHGYARMRRPFDIIGRTFPYMPKPFEAEQLMLSPLGGWLRSRGNWTPPAGSLNVRQIDPGPFDLSEWVHVATQGRDHYVRIVYEGELLPFHNRASLIKVTERKFKEANGVIVAYMMQRMFIVVREPEKRFNDRGHPFQRVRLTTLVTPDIADPKVIGGTSRSFWVEVMTSATTRDQFRFHAVGTDKAGEPVDFTIPLMFVSISDAGKPEVTNAYNHTANVTRRDALVPGQKVAFAERDPAQAQDNTRLVALLLNFIIDPSANGNPPRMLKANVKIPQVEELLGTNVLTTIRYFKGYVEQDFDAANGVFAEVVKENLDKYDLNDKSLRATVGIKFSSDQAGGIATPDMALSTLTRSLGPLAGAVEDAVVNKFDPAKFFPKGLARLFGSFDLFELLQAGTPGQNAPKMRTETQDIAGGKLIVSTLEWEPEIKNAGSGAVAAFQKDFGNKEGFDGVSQLNIHGRVEKPVKFDGAPAGESKFEFNGRLTNFTVSIMNKSVSLNVTEFSFDSRANRKPDVTVKLHPTTPVEFGGDLKFIEELRRAIPPDLFGKGPSVELLDNPLGVRAGFALALPPIAVGVFALKDVSLGAALTLPFLDGKPVFDFNVSERAHPFLLAVGIFGGGGFFHLQLDTAGIKQLEAAFEFGATAALDIGVASGEVHIMAGIYFSMRRKEPGSQLVASLTGYLRLGGSLSVLGLIRISVEFVLSFTYDGARDKAYGRATLTVQVEILFFSASVELTVERAFGGQNGDPPFGELMNTPEAWEEYALAFA